MSADTIVVLDAMGVLYQPADDVSADVGARKPEQAIYDGLLSSVSAGRAVCSSMTDWKT